MTRARLLATITGVVAVTLLVLVGLKFQMIRAHLLRPTIVDATDGSGVYQDSAHGFTLAIPEEWTVKSTPVGGGGGMTLVSFESPSGTGYNTLTAWRHPKGTKISARKWAEQEVAAGLQMGKKDGTVRPNSWSNRTVAGRPAASLITDLTAGSDDFTVYHVYAMTDTSSMKFRFMIPAGEFAHLKPDVDAMLDSCTVN